MSQVSKTSNTYLALKLQLITKFGIQLVLIEHFISFGHTKLEGDMERDAGRRVTVYGHAAVPVKLLVLHSKSNAAKTCP